MTADLVAVPNRAAARAAIEITESTLALWQQQADMLADTDIVPAGYRNKPGNILAAAMMGADLGWSLMRSLQAIHSWTGWSKEKVRDPVTGRITGEKWVERPVTMLSSEGKLSLLRDRGHRLEQLEYSNKVCCLRGTRADNGEQITVRVTIGDAERAGLTAKAIWSKYPRQMLFWRAVSELCGALCPDALMGLTANTQDFDSTPPAEMVERGDVVDVELLERVPEPVAALEVGAAEAGNPGGVPVDVSEVSAAVVTNGEYGAAAETAPANPKLVAMTAVLEACGNDRGAARDCWQAMNNTIPWGAIDDHGAWATDWLKRSGRSKASAGPGPAAAAPTDAERCEYSGRDGRRCVRAVHDSSNHRLEPKSDGGASDEATDESVEQSAPASVLSVASATAEASPEHDSLDDPLAYPDGEEPWEPTPGHEPRETLL